MTTFLDHKQILLIRNDSRFQERCVKPLRDNNYKYGFSTTIESDEIKSGLDEETIKLISEKSMSEHYLNSITINPYTYSFFYRSDENKKEIF